MDFELSDDEQSLADAVRALCGGRFPLEQVRAGEQTGEGPDGKGAALDAEGWAELGRAGIFTVQQPEDAGGTGLGMAAAAVVFEELGRALVRGPLVASNLAAGLIAGADDGTSIVGAVRRPNGASAHRFGTDGIAPVLVAHLDSLSALVVVDTDAGTLSAVDPATLVAEPLTRSLDPLTPLWRVEQLPGGERLTAGDGARWRRDAAVLLGAQAVGLATATLEMAVAYAKEREQFGKPIGSFQAVKHICADMLVRAETARAAVYAAAVTIDQPEVGDAERAAAGAGLLAAEAAQANGRSCIQVHGGMGFTWEVPAHLYLMRARMIAAELGPAAELAVTVAERY